MDAACGHPEGSAGWAAGLLEILTLWSDFFLPVFLPTVRAAALGTRRVGCPQGAQRPWEGLSPSSGRAIVCVLPTSREQLCAALLPQRGDESRSGKSYQQELQEREAAGSPS